MHSGRRKPSQAHDPYSQKRFIHLFCSSSLLLVNSSLQRFNAPPTQSVFLVQPVVEIIAHLWRTISAYAPFEYRFYLSAKSSETLKYNLQKNSVVNLYVGEIA